MTTIANTARIALAASGRSMTVTERATLAADTQTGMDLDCTFKFNRFTQGFIHAYNGAHAPAYDEPHYVAGWNAGLAA
jgi:hypothetical protein